MPLITRPSPILLMMTLLVGAGGLAACGDADPDTSSSPLTSTSPVPTVVPDPNVASDVTSDDQSAPDTDDAAGTSAARAVVTFEADGSTREFELDECYTSVTDPGRFATSGDDKGSFASHGIDADGWELQLSVLPDASGGSINMSFLTDGENTDYQLGNLEYDVADNVVTASAASDIYQTFDEEEAIPLSFVVTC